MRLTLSITLLTLGFALIHAASLPLNEKRKLVKRSASEQHTVQIGHDIKLTCEANGPSAPIIHWLHNEQLVKQSPSDSKTDNMMAQPNPGSTESEFFFSHDYYTVSELLIKNVKPEDAGQYKCVADLPGERRTQSYDVIVTPASFEHSQPGKRSEAGTGDTRIYLYTDSVYEFEGVSTRLICRGTQGLNKQPPKIFWFLNDEMITSEMSEFQLQNNGDLIITETANPLHMADMRCRAIGDDGNYDEKETFIYLYAPQ